MPIRQIPQDAASALHFVTLTAWRWYYAFDRHDRWQILANSLRFLQERRGLKIFGFVFMLNHLHLIVRAPDAAACIRDFKPHPALSIRESIRRHEPDILPLFLDNAGRMLEMVIGQSRLSDQGGQDMVGERFGKALLLKGLKTPSGGASPSSFRRKPESRAAGA